MFQRIRPNAFGREREDDRVAAVWLDFKTLNRLPRHVPAVNMVLRSGEREEWNRPLEPTRFYQSQLIARDVSMLTI